MKKLKKDDRDISLDTDKTKPMGLIAYKNIN
jgi:hypothetical protein